MIGLRFNTATGEIDLALDDAGDLESSAELDLETSILVSLHTNRRVEASEVPDGVDRGGWWGDAYRRDEDDAEGSRLWLLMSSGANGSTEALRRAEDYALEALDWMLSDGVVEALEASASLARPGLIGLCVSATVSGELRRFLIEVPV